MAPPDEYAVVSTQQGRTRPAQLDKLYIDIPLLTDLLMLFVLVVVTEVVTGAIDAPTGIYVFALALVLSRSSERSERLHVAALDDGGKLLRAGVFAFAGMSLLVTLLPDFGDPRESRTLLWVSGLSIPTLIFGRSLHYAVRRAAARRGLSTKTLVVGAGEVARELISVLGQDAAYGLEVVGAVDDSARYTGQELGTRVVGNLSELAAIARTHRAEAIIVAFGGSNDAAALAAVREVMSMDIDIWVVPRFFEMGGDLTGFDHIGSVPVVKIHARTQVRRGWRLKRALDLVISFAGVAIAGPLMLLIAAAIKLDSKGPILYKQERVGVRGRSIRILKFRTMISSSDHAQDNEWSARSDRVTRVGAFLRSSGLDELPQLFNVLRGDLTLVGPRPERPMYVEMFDAMYPHYSTRHRVPAGITGWAQIHGLRGDTSIDERARFDNYYIENWSFWNDLKILMLTSRTLMSRYRGAVMSPEKPGEENSRTAQGSE